MSVNIPIGKFRRVIGPGNSIMAGNGTGAQPLYGIDDLNVTLGTKIRALYKNPVTGADNGAPVFIPSGNSGDKVADIIANEATRIFAFDFTDIFFELCTNDLGTNLATLQTQITQLISDVRTPANCPTFCRGDTRAIHWFNVAFVGEKWDGTNANDTAIANVNNLLATLADSLNFHVIDVRSYALRMLKILNPTNINGNFLSPASDGAGERKFPLMLVGFRIFSIRSA